MKQRLKKWFNLDALLENVEGLVETRIQLFQLQVQESLAEWRKYVLAQVLTLILISAAGLFLLTAGALALGAWLGNTALGFLAGGGVLALVGGITYRLAKHYKPSGTLLNKTNSDQQEEDPEASDEEMESKQADERAHVG